ncbi:HNH endonuclease signature motif containing protein [Pseudomonas guariconensis]|uniref:HNH endonuclease signature motif containing protein n=1 Tax=Pseudomonas guariconensis TaxID=1288410 RepID=UPI003983B1BB
MIPIEYLRQSLDYCPQTGRLTWKRRPFSHFRTRRSASVFNSQFAGREAGTVSFKKSAGAEYRKVCVSGSFGSKTIEAHRLAYAIYHGEWPEMVDHFDGNTLNNRISNLRPANRSVNGRNRRLARHNTSGVPGVSRHGRGWVAHGGGSPKEYLGRFPTIFEAACARKSYELRNGYTLRHGEVAP